MKQYKFGKNQRPKYYLPPGNYRVRIKDARSAISPSGNEMIRLELVEPEQGVQLRDQLVLTDNCFWKVDEFCRCFDLGFEEGDSPTFDQEFVDSLPGLTGTVRIKDEQFNGSTVSKIKTYLPAEESELVRDEE